MNGWEEMRLDMQRRRRADRARPGPCLLCGRYRQELLPGRIGGRHVYCELCAIGTRTPATLEQDHHAIDD